MTRAILNLIALLLLAGCGATPFFTGGRLLLAPTAVSLSVGGTQQFTVTGGVPPYQYSVTSNTLGSSNATGFLTTAWKSGSGIFTVRDASGQNASAQLSIASGVLALGNGSSVQGSVLLRDNDGKRLMIGMADADLGGRLYGTPNTSQGVFVAKTNDAGQVEWLTQVLPSGGDVFETVSYIDASGALFITGSVQGLMPNSTTYGTGHGTFDLYLMKINSDGTLAWLTQVGPGALRAFGAVQFPQFDPSGNIFLGGQMTGDIGGTPYNLPTNPGSATVQLMKFAPNGTRTWGVQMGGGGVNTNTFSTGFFVGTDGTTYQLGQTSGNMGGTSLNLGGGATSNFVAYIDANGTRSWVTQLFVGASSSWSYVYRALDGSGGSYVPLGSISVSLAGASFVGSHGNRDAALIKLDSAGGLAWVKQIGAGGATNSDSQSMLQSDDGTALYLSGTTNGSIGGTLVGPARGTKDAFLIKLDAAGAASWNYTLAGGGATTTEVYRLQFDPTKSAFAFVGTTTGVISTQLGSHGARDTYVAQFNTTSGYTWATQLGGGASSLTDFVFGQNLDLLFGYGGNAQYTANAIYLAGTSDGSLGGLTSGIPGGPSDFVAKFNLTGALGWVNQFTVGAAATFTNRPSISVQPNGEVFLSDSTNASLTGLPPKAHGSDTVIIKFDANGVWQ